MGHRDDIEQTAEEERALHEHPARPEQTHDEGYERGYEERRDTPERGVGDATPGTSEARQMREPNFARGISAEPPGGEHHGRFSQGAEELPEDDPEKHVERRFSEGIERDPTST